MPVCYFLAWDYDSMSSCQVVKRPLPDSQPSIRGSTLFWRESGDETKMSGNFRLSVNSADHTSFITSGALVANK
jgi:hypothetical protein